MYMYHTITHTHSHEMRLQITLHEMNLHGKVRKRISCVCMYVCVCMHVRKIEYKKQANVISCTHARRHGGSVNACTHEIRTCLIFDGVL